VFLSGEPGVPHINTVTGSASDGDGNTDEDSDDATVNFSDALPAITVTKTAIPTSVVEPGGAVTFSITVTNLVGESLTLDSLTDSVFGDLNGSGSCSVPQTMAPAGDPGDSYSCSFSDAVVGQPGDVHTNTVSAVASDNDGNPAGASDDADVTFDDILPEISVVKTADPTVVPETGGNVTYTVTVTNLSAEALTLDSLSDSIYADISPCAVPQALAAAGDPGDFYTCSFTEWVSGTAGDTVVNWITANASDDDGNSDEVSDDAGVEIQDVEPNVSVEKTADPTIVPETGGVITYLITITNTGSVDIDVLTLVDDRFGDLTGRCSLPIYGLVPFASFTCPIMEWISGTAGDIHTNTVIVSAEDEQGNQVGDEDDASVEFSDVLPDITVVKTAAPTVVSELGGDVTYTVVVTNNAPIPVTLDSLVDDVFGPLQGAAGSTCSVPQTLAPTGDPGDEYSCEFTETVSGEPGVPHINTVTASASDGDGNTDTDIDDATVNFTDVQPEISVLKTADPTRLSPVIPPYRTSTPSPPAPRIMTATPTQTKTTPR
jgi:uncharacterized repeat protein (TIGR01451 family)